MNPSRRGFTLLELLVAAALAAVVLSAVAVLLGRGLRAWTEANARLERLFGIEKGLNRFGEELRNGLFLGSADPPFVGEKDRIQFFVAQGPDRLVKVTYRVSTGEGRSAWVREAEPFPISFSAAEAANSRGIPPQAGFPIPEETDSKIPPQKVIAQVSDLSFRYGYLKEKAGTPMLRWEESWETARLKQLPRLVQIRVETKDRRFGIQTVTREWWVPHGILGKDPQP